YAPGLAGRRGQGQAAVAGPDPVPDSDEDADAGRVDEGHAGEVHDQAAPVLIGYDPEEGVAEQAAGGHVNFTGYRNHGDVYVETVAQDQPLRVLSCAHSSSWPRLRRRQLA